MRPLHVVTRCEYKLWTNARGTTLFTAAWRTPARTIGARSPSLQDATWQDSGKSMRWRRCNQDQNWPMYNYSVKPFQMEPHTWLCFITQCIEIHVLGMAKKKKINVSVQHFFLTPLFIFSLEESLPTAKEVGGVDQLTIFEWWRLHTRHSWY